MRTMKSKTYYHILEYGSYGDIGWQGYYSDQNEAKTEVDRLKEYFPDSVFEIWQDTSNNEPPITTV